MNPTGLGLIDSTIPGSSTVKHTLSPQITMRTETLIVMWKIRLQDMQPCLAIYLMQVRLHINNLAHYGVT